MENRAMNLQFQFDGNMSREVLESYLSRAVTAAFLIESNTLEDDLRVIERLGVKFLGRASGTWGATGNDELHFARSKALADRVHAQDPDVDKIADIPCDYDGVMGVPITFLDKYSPEQFEIVGATESEGKGFSMGLLDSTSKISQPLVNGQKVYKRIFIKRQK